MSFFGELKRRNVVKVAVAYAIVGWLLIEVASVLLPTFLAPEWVMRVFSFFVIAGFPVALILSWAYELTPEGMKKSHEVETTESITHVTGRKIDFAIIGALVLVLGFIAVDQYVLEESSEVATVEVEPADSPPSTVAEEPREVLPNSVAVLLCDNLSPDSDDAYVAASIHLEILGQLRKLRNLTPIARGSVLQYSNETPPAQIADELRVETVMRCSVRYAGDDILVAAELIDPETNLVLWDGNYPGSLTDVAGVFAMQADIAMNIANALQAEFSVEEQASIERQPTESGAAYELYLRAISLFQADGSRDTTISLLTRAIELDPEFGLAYATAARSFAASLVSTFGNPAAEPGERENLEAEARRFAQDALRLDSSLGIAYTALALIDQAYWRWDEADQAFEQALEVVPNDPLLLLRFARHRSFQGDHENAIETMRRVVDLNPTAGSYYVLASVLAHAGNLEAALEPARRAVELAPGSPVPHLWFARIGSALDMEEEVTEHLRIAERLLVDTAAPVGLASLAFSYSRIGNDEAASRVLEQLDAATPDREFDAGSWIMGYLAQGNEDAAFASLQTVVNRVQSNEPDAAFYGLMIIKSNAQRHPVLDKSRFRDLRSQIGSSN